MPRADTGRLALWVALGAGIVLRLRQFLHGRPLWIDEAMLADNILLRDFAGLLRPLDSDQAAPVPFLWLVRLAAVVGGADERVLRLVPFLVGLVLLWLFARVAWRLLAPGPAALATGIVALSPLLAFYGNELKPYGLDACLGVALSLGALHLAEAPGERARWLLLGVLGLVTSLASMAAPLLLAGVGVGLWLAPAIREAEGGRRRLVLWSLAWAGAFLIPYLLLYRATAGSAYMQRYWAPAFVSPALPGIGEKLVWLPLQHLLWWFTGDGGPLRYAVAILLVAPIVTGAGAFARTRGWWLVALLLLPLAGAAVLSAIRLYPLSPRLLLFAVPSLALLIGRGVAHLADRLSRHRGLPWFALGSVGVLAFPVLEAERDLREPPEREALRPLVETLVAQAEPGAAIYVYGRAVPAWLFYTTDWRAPDSARVVARLTLVSSTGAAFRHAGPRGHRVAQEGDGFAYPFRGWTELVGVATGTGPDSLGVNGEVVDSGWAENEARRIMATGRTEAWLVFSSHRAEVPGLLDSALAARGGERTFVAERNNALVARWRLP